MPSQDSKPPLTLKEWLSTSRGILPQNELELILLHTLGWQGADRSALVLHEDDTKITASLQSELNAKIAHRKCGEPLAYILGQKDFYGRRFSVDQRALIPRPETETIIDLTLALPKKPRAILELGTGSGCIAITLALELPSARIIATDISPPALSLAKQNAKALNAKLEFKHSDLLENIGGNFDLIVANLPYVDRNWAWLDTKNLSYEPSLALYAKDGGCALIFRLLEEARDHTHVLLLEADPCEHQRIIEYAKHLGWKHQQTTDFILQFNADSY